MAKHVCIYLNDDLMAALGVTDDTPAIGGHVVAALRDHFDLEAPMRRRADPANRLDMRRSAARNSPEGLAIREQAAIESSKRLAEEVARKKSALATATEMVADGNATRADVMIVLTEAGWTLGSLADCTRAGKVPAEVAAVLAGDGQDTPGGV